MTKRTPRPKDRSATLRGPRGGTTTITDAGLVRKTVYFTRDEWEAIRRAAFEQDVSYSQVIQEAVRAELVSKRRVP